MIPKILPGLPRNDSLIREPLFAYFYPLHTYLSVMATHTLSIHIRGVPDDLSHRHLAVCWHTISAQPVG